MSGPIEDPLIVSFEDLLARLLVQKVPQRLILAINP
jgi:hypothetical protein